MRDNPALNATSRPIYLVVPTEGTPTPYVTSIEPRRAEEGQTITFRAGAQNAHGNVTYRWTSDLEVLYEGEKREFNTTLSPGVHTIELQARDLRGNWSEPVTRSVTVEEDALRGFLYSTEFRIAVLIILIGVTMNFVGKHVVSKPREE